MRIIPRRIELKKIEESLPWVLIYGRRKTGKTFIIDNFVEHDKFFFVNRDSTVFDKKNGELYTYNEFIKVFREIIEDKRIVIDEFHRLPENFLDYLHSIGTKGNLILITSTLRLAKHLLGRRSPLIGLIRPVKIDLIDEREILVKLADELNGKELIETSVYLREVMLIPYYKRNIQKFITNFLIDEKIIIKELIGEIFTEEERELTNIYEGIMKAVAVGKHVSTEISTFLFSRNVLAKDNPGVLQKYLNTLVTMGILEKVKVWGKNKFRYFHHSPLFDMHYYLEEKYSYTEVETPATFIRKVVEAKIPYHVEQFFRNLFVKIFGLQHTKIEEKNFEIDIALFEFKKPKVVAEIKWKKKISRADVKRVEEKLGKFKNCRKILVVPEKNALETVPKNLEVWCVDDVVDAARKSLYSIK